MANQQYYGIATNTGLALLANAALLGNKVNVTQFAVGDANGVPYYPQPEMTALKHEVWRGNITEIVQSETSPNMLTIHGLIPANIGGWTIAEIGAFDDSGNLVFLWNCAPFPKVVMESGQSDDVYFNLQVALDNASSVNISIDPNVVLATKQDINNLRIEVQGKIDAVSTDLQSHVENTEVHLQPEEREKWNAASEGRKKPIVISDTQPEDTAQEINGLWLQPVTNGDETEKDYKVYVKTAANTYTESNLETAASMVIYSDSKTAEEKYTELSEAISSAEEEITALQESQSTQGTDLTEVKSRAIIAASATGSGAEITLELPNTPKAGSLITFKAPAAAAEGTQIKVGETAYPVLDLDREPVKAEAWAADSMVTLALGDTNAFLQGGKGGSTALIKPVILTALGWALDDATQLFKQQVTIAELEADHKVDFDISPLLLASLEADITPVNQNGTLYAYTSEAPASDLSVQATLTKVEVVS